MMPRWSARPPRRASRARARKSTADSFEEQLDKLDSAPAEAACMKMNTGDFDDRRGAMPRCRCHGHDGSEI